MNQSYHPTLKALWNTLPADPYKRSLKRILDLSPQANYSAIWAIIGPNIHPNTCIRNIIAGSCADSCNLEHYEQPLLDAAAQRIAALLKPGMDALNCS